jgi:hypothetical protein
VACRKHKADMHSQLYFKFLSLIIFTILGLLGGCTISKTSSLASTQPEKTIEYHNSDYGFSFTLPASWKRYSIITDEWQGYTYNGQNEVIVEKGPIISVRHPLWKSEKPRQDIPIWVFTINQWNSFQQNQYNISAGGITTELGRNKKYVFALYSLYNFAELPGFEEVITIFEGNPLHVP